MEHYYPLDVESKVRFSKCGTIPSKNSKKFKINLLKKCPEDKSSFEEILSQIYSNLNKCKNYFSRKDDPPNIIPILCKIIPMDYFGVRSNRKRFLFIVKRILTQTRGEYIHICVVYEGFDYGGFHWLNRGQDAKIQVLNANIILLQMVVKPFIRYYYHFLNTYRSRQYLIVPKGKIHSFVDRNICKAVKLRQLEKINEPIKQSSLRGKLIFVPKKGLSQLDHRALAQSYSRNKCLLEEVKRNLKCLIGTFQIGREHVLYEKWKAFVLHNKRRKKLYAVKLDLADAFGMVDREVLRSVIKNDEIFLTFGQKQFLFETLSQQYVHTRGRNQIYNWRHGLLQGTRLSPVLCELYLSYITHTRLKVFNKANCFFHRTVDDMFFVSTCESQVYEFELAVFAMSRLNEEKTQRFLNTGEDPSIVFCGKNFNLETRETCTPYDFQKGKELRGKFKFWNRKYQFTMHQPYEFIVNSMKYAYVNFYFSRFELNTTYNRVKTVLKNIFDGMCYVGFKLFYLVDSIDYLFKSAKDRCNTILRAIDFILSSYSRIILKTIGQFKGEYYEGLFSYNLIKFLILKAFIVVLRRRNFKYQEVIGKMKDRTKRMGIPNLKKHIDIKYFFKLPKPFDNISMKRSMDTSDM